MTHPNGGLSSHRYGAVKYRLLILLAGTVTICGFRRRKCAVSQFPFDRYFWHGGVCVNASLNVFTYSGEGCAFVFGKPYTIIFRDHGLVLDCGRQRLVAILTLVFAGAHEGDTRDVWTSDARAECSGWWKGCSISRGNAF